MFRIQELNWNNTQNKLLNQEYVNCLAEIIWIVEKSSKIEA